MDINILTDNENSWIIPYAKSLVKDLESNHKVSHYYSSKKVSKGDLLILLSCERLVSKAILSLNRKNIVVHPSELPHGKGWSPLAWQILEGKNKIPITLFEANEKLDSGDIYLRDYIELEGHELNNEIKEKQGAKTIEMVKNFIENIDNAIGISQDNEGSFYSRRTQKDSEIDIDKTIRKQFNLLRIVDNDRYPAYFYNNGEKYIIRIDKE